MHSRTMPLLTALSLSLLLVSCNDTPVEVGTPVSSTADSGPGSLRQLLAAARDGDTLRFTTTGTVTLSSPLTASKDVTIRAAGVTFDAGGKGRVLEVASGADITLQGGTLKGGVGQPIELPGSTPLSQQALSKVTYGGVILNRGNLTLDGTTVTNGQAMNGGGIYNAAGATLTLRTANVTGNQTLIPDPEPENEPYGDGGGVYNEGVLNLQSGAVSANTSTYSGGGIYNFIGGTVNISGGEVRDNRCTYPITVTDNVTGGCAGGGVFSLGNMTVSAGSISSNTASYFGGGVAMQARRDEAGQVLFPTFTLSGGRIEGNKTDRTDDTTGGGLFVNGTLVMTGGTVKGNSSSSGGGLTVFTNATLTGGSIEGNTANDGAGIYAYTPASRSSTLTLDGAVSLTANEAARAGGGVYVERTALNMLGGSVQGNSAVDNGGGIVFGGGTVSAIQGGSVAGNRVTGSTDGGGGLRLYSNTTVNLSGGEIRDNTAVHTGGGVTMSGQLNMTGGIISGNSATGTAQGQGGGGGIRMYTKAVMVASGGTISGNTGRFAGGVWVGGAFNNESAAQFTMSGATISGNQATQSDGGGIFNQGSVTVQSGSVTGNKAVTRGGGIINDKNATYSQTGGSVTGNTPDNVYNE